ncbi:unnamed protein product [Brassicogethes aeneus]|uniref:Uncharacterized protein n=1 Tax=Brassicogethes aeneus TaxID=1431903 RepID=A0A9P0AUC4_BRAAE|nr:unnamed protein product [Brassicogethes aeneus]
MFENDMKLPKMENVRERPLYDYVLDYIKSRNFNVTLSKYYEKLGTINCGDPYILLDDAKETLRKTEKNLSKQRKRQEEKRKVIVKEYELFEEKEKIFRNNFLRFDKVNISFHDTT